MTTKSGLISGVRLLTGVKFTAEVKRILSDNLLATFATTFAGLLGFALQSLVSHTLHPVEFGGAFALISFFSIAVRPAATVGRLVAWRTSRESASHVVIGESSALLRATIKWLLLAGFLISLLSVLAGRVIAAYIHLNLVDVAVASLSAPFLLAFQPLLGALQGDKRFKSWSILNIVLPLSYIVFVTALVFPYGIIGVISGVSLGSAISFAFGIYLLRDKIWPRAFENTKLHLKTYAPFLSTGLATTLTVGVFMSADVIVVQHFFNRTEAGQYAIVAVIGNALFSVAGGALSATFPNIVTKQSRGQSTIPILLITLAAFVVVTVLGATVLQLFGIPILRTVGGTKYLGGASFIGWYSLGMGMLSWATVLIHTQQARNRLHLLWSLKPPFIYGEILMESGSAVGLCWEPYCSLLPLIY